MTDYSPDTDRRDRPGLLLAGAVAGIAVAAWATLDSRAINDGLSAEAVASVNGRLISREHFDRSLQRQQTDSDEPLDDDDKRWVLQRLIEEELLVQRGLELGVAYSENDVRGAIVRSLVASVTAEADAANPGDDALRRWFMENPERFTTASALSIDGWICDSQAAARSFADSLLDDYAAEAPAGVRRLPGLPRGLLPASKLRDYIGPGVTTTLEKLPIGGVAVYARRDRWLIVRMADRRERTVADFQSVKSQALVEYRRALADKKLRDYLRSLRDRADVIIASQ